MSKMKALDNHISWSRNTWIISSKIIDFPSLCSKCKSLSQENIFALILEPKNISGHDDLQLAIPVISITLVS